MTLSRSPQCRAVADEKLLSPLFSIGGLGAAVTNDWCIKNKKRGKAIGN